jgi:hypothetical protein
MDDTTAAESTAAPTGPDAQNNGSTAATAPDTHLSKELQELLEGLGGKDITIGGLLDHIGDRGFGLLLLVLALPAALPIPAPGYATPFGVLMVILGAQMVVGRAAPVIPPFFAKRTVRHGILKFSIENGHLPLKVVEFLIRPRLRAISRNRAFRSAVGLIIVMMAAFMSLPIPLTNTAPSFVIFVLAAGLLEEDGLMLLAGLLLAPVAAAIAGGALYVAATMGPEAVETTLKPMIKGLLGMGA